MGKNWAGRVISVFVFLRLGGVEPHFQAHRHTFEMTWLLKENYCCQNQADYGAVMLVPESDAIQSTY